MKTFQQLRFEVESGRADDLVAAIQSKLTDGWTRKPDVELTPSQRVLSMRVFSCDERNGREAADLFLMVEESALQVANILPGIGSRLDYDQYNTILNSFLESGARGAAKKLGVREVLTPPEIDLSKYISKVDQKNLRNVVAARTASGWHQLDEDRWVEFLLSMHRKHWKLSVDDLQRWLAEELGASPGLVEELVLKYESAKELLTRYDGRNPRAA